jgi:hypothetical protein
MDASVVVRTAKPTLALEQKQTVRVFLPSVYRLADVHVHRIERRVRNNNFMG